MSFLQAAKALHPRVEDDIVDRRAHRGKTLLQISDGDELIDRFCRNSRSEFCHVVVHSPLSRLVKRMGLDSILERIFLL